MACGHTFATKVPSLKGLVAVFNKTKQADGRGPMEHHGYPLETQRSIIGSTRYLARGSRLHFNLHHALQSMPCGCFALASPASLLHPPSNATSTETLTNSSLLACFQGTPSL